MLRRWDAIVKLIVVSYVVDYVNLTVGAKVIGNITIGNYSIVAPNSVVIKDVSDYDIVSGVPAKVIKTNAPKR